MANNQNFSNSNQNSNQNPNLDPNTNSQPSYTQATAASVSQNNFPNNPQSFDPNQVSNNPQNYDQNNQTGFNPNYQSDQTQNYQPQYVDAAVTNANIPQNQQFNSAYSNPEAGYQNGSQSVPQKGQQSSSQTFPGNQYFQVQGAVQVQPTKNKDVLNLKGINFKKMQDWALKKWWLILLVVVGISVLALGIFAIFAKPPVPTGPFNNVVGSIQAPVTSPGGSPNTWKIKVTNNEKVNLEDVEVTLKFDKSFRYTKSVNPEPSDTLGTKYSYSRVAGSGLGTSEILIQFEGVLNGQIDEETIMTGEVSYTPSPLVNTTNGRKTIPLSSAKTKITAPEIKLLLVPRDQEVQNGSEAQITATFENTSGRELKDLQIRLNYPDRNSFTYQSSELNLGGGASPKTTPDNGNNVWNISTLPSQRQSTLIVKGILSGSEEVKQVFTIEIAIKNGNNFQVLANTSRDITVKSQPLAISTLIEGRDSTKMFKQGESLVVTVNYQNKSSKTLQNLEVLAFLDDPANVLDYSTISFVGGSTGNLSNKVVQWRSSGNPSFSNVVPQQKGSVSFSIKTKTGAAFLSSGLNQNTYTLRPRGQAKASNLEQIETSGDLYKAAGDLEFTQTVALKASPNNPANRKTYTITWTLKTKQNKINGALVETTSNLPPTSWLQSSISPANAASQLSYDSVTGKIIWKAGDLNSYTGLSNPIATISFDLDYDTTAASSNTLFEASKISGIDDFTGEKFVLNGQPAQAN